MDDISQLDDTVLVAEIRRMHAELDGNADVDLMTRYQALTREFTRRSDAIFAIPAACEAEISLQSMDDPAFLAERRRVLDTIEALTERLEKLDEEFIRRASLAWTAGDAE